MNYLPILSHGSVVPERETGWKDSLPASLKRRDPRIWQLAYVASKRALDSAGKASKSIVCGTALGALDETRGYLDGVFKDGFGSPRHFIASVHNSMAGKLALEFKIDGPNLTVCEGQNTLASSIVTASLLSPEECPVLVVIVDENIALMQQVLPYLSNDCRAYLAEGWDEAAVALVLDAPAPRKEPCIAAVGPSAAGNGNPMEACAALAAGAGMDPRTLSPLDETSDSFLKPALCVDAWLRNRHTGEFGAGSYSPSARAAALVSLCL
ncbi:MAG: hypothetical protein GF418_14495 [Chitinivibrionales bacterium]|nr:hypothetical protein [Chitinivibrionales bacterium]MBD3396830.1 hypothetical protein [Chitinivibrionales bacterium]